MYIQIINEMKAANNEQKKNKIETENNKVINNRTFFDYKVFVSCLKTLWYKYIYKYK